MKVLKTRERLVSQRRSVNFIGLVFQMFLLRYELLSSKWMHVFEVLFLYFHENRAEFSSLPNPLEQCGPTRKQPEIIFHKNHAPEDEEAGNGKI